MKSAEFIALSGCTMTLTALGIDVMLPAFAEIRSHFGLEAGSTETAHIITFFFMGQIAQIIFGTLSDSYGRIPILRIGFPLYIIGGIAAAIAPDLPTMYAARFVAGMGASSLLMITVAGVRDRFVGDQMARIMSLIFTIFLFTPVAAPFLGIAILSFSNWQAVFLAPPAFAVIIFFWSLRLKESLPPNQRIRLSWRNIAASVKTVITNLVFIRYTTITTLLFTALSSYVSSSEHIIGEIYGKPGWFAWIFAGMGLLMASFTYVNSWLTGRFGARRTIRGLLLVYFAVSAALLLATLVYGDPPAMILFFIPLCVLMALNLAVEPNSSALAMEPMGEMAGTASAVYGTCFFFVGASLGSIISELMVHKVMPIVVSLVIIGFVCVILVITDVRPFGRAEH